MFKGRFVTAIIAAGGMGKRFGAENPKQFLQIGGKAMISAATEPFLCGSYVDEIVFTAPQGYIEQACGLIERELGAVSACADAGAGEGKGIIEGEGEGEGRELRVSSGGRMIRLCVVSGGGDRAESVMAALSAANEKAHAGGGLVLIHDAARPFVSALLIERVLEAAYDYGAAIPTVPIRDTVYKLGGDDFAETILDRSSLRGAQTPQGFDFGLIRDAHARSRDEGLFVTDDGAPALANGNRVRLVEGEPENIKITLPEDIQMRTLAPQGGGMRAGIGFDAHRFCEGRPLVLGGVEIPFERGLAGHSDADALTHALMDAILGALREGDIGKMFPDTDPAWEGASSLSMLGEVVSLMRRRGFGLINADLTLVAERPRMAPYREDVCRALAAVLMTAPENVSLKATTTEKLGFTGREEGIAAEAIVLLGKDGTL